MTAVAVSGAFDDLRSHQLRFLEEAARLGMVHVALWSDNSLTAMQGYPPRFPEAERLYLLQSLRFVDRVTIVRGKVDADGWPEIGIQPDVWLREPEPGVPGTHTLLDARAIGAYPTAEDNLLAPAPIPIPPATYSARKRVVVTGSYDWFHSGHVRFFEEASALGDLYVVVGHDANIKLLKGEGHPLLPQAERLYIVRAVRYVQQAMISTGHGWMDAEPEIDLVKPHFYVVNGDGDKPEKKAFCAKHGIQYVVLNRGPKEGLPRRESTGLRGF